MAMGLTKPKRHEKLRDALEKNPFLTDEELARLFAVSVQTIRLDRLEMGIPELRERVKQVAERSHSEVKSLRGSEIIGELVDLVLDRSAISVLEITEHMVFVKNGIARGHFIFAQANSLAIACIDAEVALTGTAKVSFKRPVKLAEKVISKAIVKSKKGNKYTVYAESKIGAEVVFDGIFVVFVATDKEANLG